MKKQILTLAIATAFGVSAQAQSVPKSYVDYAQSIKSAHSQLKFIDSMITNYTRTASTFDNMVKAYGARFGDRAWFQPILKQHAWYTAELARYQALRSSLVKPVPVVITVADVKTDVAYTTAVEIKPAVLVQSAESVVEETVGKIVNVYAVLTSVLETTTVTTTYATTTTVTRYSDGNAKTQSNTRVDNTANDVKSETIVSRNLIRSYAVVTPAKPEATVADQKSTATQGESVGTPTLNVLTVQEYLSRTDVNLGQTETYKQAALKMNSRINLDYIQRESGLRLYGNSLAVVGAPDAWARGWTGKGSTIAILDTGIDLDHPEFAGRIVDTKCFSNGCVENGGRETIQDGNGHGTHVAGIAAAALDGVGTTGVAPDAKLLIGKLATASGIYDMTKLPAALTWAANSGAVVANISANYNIDTIYKNSMVVIEPGLYRSTDTRAKYATLSYSNLLRDGNWTHSIAKSMQGTELVVVAAAGNQGLPYATFPAHLAVLENPDGTLALGGRMIVAGNYDVRSKKLASTSNRAGTVCFDYNQEQNTCNGNYRIKDFYLMAPGQFVASTDKDGDYITKSGTSMAAPVISGAVAVIHQMWPHMKGENLVRLLLNTGNKDIPNYDENIHGQGLLDLAEATSPQGSLGIPVTGRVDGARREVSAGTISVAGASISALDQVMVVDSYDRDFYFNANTLVSAADTRMVSPTVNAQTKAGADAYLSYAQSSRLPVSSTFTMSIAPDGSSMGMVKAFGNINLGVVSEGKTFLGNTVQSDLARIDGATTTYLGYSSDLKVTNRLTAFGSATVGISALNVDKGTMLKSASLMLSNSATLGARFALNQKSELGMVASLPVAIVKGTATFNMPTSVDINGNIINSDVTANMASVAREYNLGVFYNNQITRNTTFGASAEMRNNKAGVAGATDVLYNVKFKTAF